MADKNKMALSEGKMRGAIKTGGVRPKGPPPAGVYLPVKQDHSCQGSTPDQVNMQMMEALQYASGLASWIQIHAFRHDKKDELLVKINQRAASIVDKVEEALQSAPQDSATKICTDCLSVGSGAVKRRDMLKTVSCPKCAPAFKAALNSCAEPIQDSVAVPREVLENVSKQLKHAHKRAYNPFEPDNQADYYFEYEKAHKTLQQYLTKETDNA